MTRNIISDRLIWRVIDYVEKHRDLRDRLMFYLLLTRGLRTGEICSLKAEWVDFDNGLIYVMDSKKKVLLPLPLDVKAFNMFEQLLNGRRKGYVFLRARKQLQYAGKPMSVQGVWEFVKRIAEQAGVKNFNPRMFRRHLAAFWMQKAGGHLAELQVIMRHANPQVTWEYANQFAFAEEISKEASRVTDEMLRRGAVVKENLRVTQSQSSE